MPMYAVVKSERTFREAKQELGETPGFVNEKV
jgi:hypothetical protein